MNDFPAFVDAAWKDHAGAPEAVAQRLAEAFAAITTPDRIIPYVRLVTHVLGEHLGRWDDGVALLQRLRETDAASAAAESAALARSIAALRYGADPQASLGRLEPAERAAALAIASSALLGRSDCARAVVAFRAALAAAPGGDDASSPAVRALAVAGNNLAQALEEKEGRTSAETRAMLDAAETGLRCWRAAGTWLEDERALYQLAKCLIAAGQPGKAAAEAQACLDVCARNDAPAFERFFGWAALAIARRAAGDEAGYAAARDSALAAHARVAPDEQAWCAKDLAAITP